MDPESVVAMDVVAMDPESAPEVAMDPESAPAGSGVRYKPDPESLFIFGSSRSLRKCQCLIDI